MLDRKSLCLAVLCTFSGSALAGAGHNQDSDIGGVASAENATRTIEVEMTDNRYNYKRINVRNGEIVRFVIHNRGRLVHEFNIGTREMHAAHQDEMLAMMQSGHPSPTKTKRGHNGMMGHDDPNSVLLNPGETKELVWEFNTATEGLEFACNVPGHYQAGMVGRFRIESI